MTDKLEKAAELIKHVQAKIDPKTVQGKHLRIELAKTLRFMLEGRNERIATIRLVGFKRHGASKQLMAHLEVAGQQPYLKPGDTVTVGAAGIIDRTEVPPKGGYRVAKRRRMSVQRALSSRRRR